MVCAGTEAIKELSDKSDVDSPVYTFLPDLGQPVGGADADGDEEGADTTASAEGDAASPSDDATVSMLMDMLLSNTYEFFSKCPFGWEHLPAAEGFVAQITEPAVSLVVARA